MIARHLEFFGKPLEHASVGVRDRRQLAVHWERRADDFTAIDLADGLVAEADAEKWNFCPSPALAMRSRQMPASFGVHGPGDKHDGLRLLLENFGGRDLVVAMHFARSAPSSPRKWTRL